MGKTLKEIVEAFGKERIDQGAFPDFTVKQMHYDNTIEHQIDLYALNGVFVIVVDKVIHEISGIAKKEDGRYTRTGRAISDYLPPNTVVYIEEPLEEFLAGFKHLHGFKNNFAYARGHNMHFDGIGKRLEDAGQLCT